MTAEERSSPVDDIREAAERGEHARAAELLATSELEPTDARALFGSMATNEFVSLLIRLEDPRARELLLWLAPEQAREALTAVPPPTASRWISGLPSDERADLLATLDEDIRSAIHEALPAAARADAARLLQYPPDTAGGLMETELLAYPASTTVREAIRDLRANRERYAAIGVQYVYVVNGQRRLLGVAAIRDLMLAPEELRLDALPRGEVVSVRDTATMQEIADEFYAHSYMGLPVVDGAGVLLGVVNRGDAFEAGQHQTEELYRVSQGIVGGEELRSMPVALRLRRRTAWLAVNLLLGLGGAAIVAIHQQTIAKALVVAAVLPLISATSGNAAMQAAAVSIRELTLGIIDPASWRRVLAVEAGLAVLMSLPLGLAVALLAQAWGAGRMIGVAVGLAMAANTLIAVGIGAICPLVLRRVGVDPALASGPVSTTLADVTGFLITLSLVSVAV